MNNSQELANLIKSIAKSKKIPIGKMLKDCELSINTLSSMQSGGYYPRLEAVCKIAEYLDCSIDFLLGRTEVLQSKIKDSLAETDEGALDEFLIHRLCSLSPEELAQVDAFVQGLLANRKD